MRRLALVPAWVHPFGAVFSSTLPIARRRKDLHGVPEVLAIAICACGGGSSPAPGAVDRSSSACKIASQNEITAQAARDLGFSVDHELALLDRSHQAPFHHGNFVCASGAVPSVDGQISIRATLQRIELQKNEPASDSIDAKSCADLLIFRTTLELGTDDGSVSGHFDAEGGSYVDGMYLSALPEPKELAGALGIRVDRNRPQRGQVSVWVALRDRSPNGQLFTRVNYSDGGSPQQDDGDGMFWPADDVDTHLPPHCGWLDPQGAPPAMMISLDEYNRLYP
jgi:hypothetical protein